MVKGISNVISFVLLTFVSITLIYLVLNVVRPTIERAYESSTMNEAGQNMQLLDNLIREVASEGTGSSRSVVLKVSDGNYRIVSSDEYFTGALLYKIDLKHSFFAAPMLKKVGNLKYAVGLNAIGLIGYWKLDGGNETIKDSSGYNNDGVFYGTITTLSNSTILYLSGASPINLSHYIFIPYYNQITTASLTVSYVNNTPSLDYNETKLWLNNNYLGKFYNNGGSQSYTFHNIHDYLRTNETNEIKYEGNVTNIIKTELDYTHTITWIT